MDVWWVHKSTAAVRKNIDSVTQQRKNTANTYCRVVNTNYPHNNQKKRWRSVKRVKYYTGWAKSRLTVVLERFEKCCKVEGGHFEHLRD